MSYEAENFEKDVIEASYRLPVIVDFWAEWCAPCRILGPVVEKLAKEFEGKIKLVKVDTEHFREEAARFGIRSIPNVKLFVDGNVKDEFVGALAEGRIREWIIKNLPESPELMRAKELVEAGKENEALTILESFLKSDPENSTALLLTARIYLFSDTLRASGILRNFEPKNDEIDTYNALSELAEMLKLFNNSGSLPEGEVKPRFADALRFLSERNFEMSLEILIGIIRDDRYYFDDAARKLCIAIFKYLGEEHPVTMEFRRDFGRALY